MVDNDMITVIYLLSSIFLIWLAAKLLDT